MGEGMDLLQVFDIIFNMLIAITVELLTITGPVSGAGRAYCTHSRMSLSVTCDSWPCGHHSPGVVPLTEHTPSWAPPALCREGGHHAHLNHENTRLSSILDGSLIDHHYHG